MPRIHNRYGFHILGMRLDCTTYASATRTILDWSKQTEGRIVCCANVHMVMECFDDPAYRTMVNSADLVTADGVPLVWALRALGQSGAARVYGPDLTRSVLAAAEREGTPVGFYGGTQNTLARLQKAVAKLHPSLSIAYACAPPFRPQTAPEEQAVIQDIRSSGVRVVFVGLGCPKQERWMARHRADLGAVLLGVGAAFDFLAGVKPQAPQCIQRAGCEWLFRLAVEPRRLWARYLRNNPRFVIEYGAQLLRTRLGAAR